MFRRLLATTATLLASLSPHLNAAQLCEVYPTNYLQDSDFSAEKADRRSPHWAGIQHRNNPGYETRIDGEGVLTIEKTAPQDWLLFRQRIPAEPFASDKLVFAAELNLHLELGDNSITALPLGGGLSLLVRDSNGKLLLTSQAESDPKHGVVPWRQVQVVFELPPGAHTIEAGFLHQADGWLQVRNPSLSVADETNTPCPITVHPPKKEPNYQPLRRL
jgi:hypothetical protein